MIVGAAALVAVAGIGAGLTAVGGGPAVGGDPSDPRQVAMGKAVYDANCASCHGAKLQGETRDWRMKKPDGTLPAPPHDETGHTWHHPDSMLFDYIKNGGQAVAPEGFKSAMPGYRDTLSDAEINAVLAYIKSTWPDHTRQRHAKITEQDQAK